MTEPHIPQVAIPGSETQTEHTTQEQVDQEFEGMEVDAPLLPLLLGAATGTLADVPPPAWKPGAAVGVVMASAGYPESSSSGDVISGLDRTPAGVEVTHAGTAERDGEIVTAGGRVLNVTALGDGIRAARAAAYAAADVITFDGMQMRRDIAGAVA